MVGPTAVGRHRHARMEHPGLQLVAAEVADGLETCVEGRLCCGFADLVPGSTWVHHLNRGIPCFTCGFDLLRVVVGVTNLIGEGVVANVALDVDAVVDFYQITLFEHHVAFPPFWRGDRVFGGEVGRDVVHRDGSGKSRLSSVPVNEALCGFDDLVPSLSWLEFFLHGFKRSTSHVKEIMDAETFNSVAKEQLEMIKEISARISKILNSKDAMIEARKAANALEDVREKAIAYYDNVKPFFEVIRYESDKLELMIDDEQWPLTKFREMLFTR